MPRRLTNRAGHDFVPAISPSGTYVALVSATAEGPQLRVLDAQGTEAARLDANFGRVTEPAWRHDGRGLVFAAASRPGAPYSLYSARLPLIDPEVIIEGRFSGAEGLSFNHEGRLFIAADRAVWEVARDGSTRRVAGFASNLGLAPDGARDIVMADFGPLVRPQAGPNRDGVIWRVTPEGATTRVAEGIGDPNAIVKLPNGHLLVSDDFVREIYEIDLTGAVRVFSDKIPFPNGLALSPDGSALYVAQLFRSAPTAPPPARYEDFSNIVWRLPLVNGRPGDPQELFRTAGEGTGPDGVAVDETGRVYVSAARVGELWRFDPRTNRRERLAAGLPGLASLAFGQGPFERESLYATQIRGGRLLRFSVGARGAPLLE
ncbi:MAG: SMP-30/gluconolactonase/LRE family protein [Acidobacteriota bacterium]